MGHDLSRRTLLVSGAAALFGTLTASCAPPQSAYQSSGHDIVDVLVPYGAGGGTDAWARFITPYFAALQDDVSRYQVTNVPGGESITGTNSYVDAGVTNGDYLLVASATTYFQSMLDHPVARFDFSRMEPLALNGTGAVLWTNAASGITSLEDLIERSEPAKYGGMSASGLDLVALLALGAVNAPVRGVFGFEGRGPSRLAVQRDETHLDFQTTSTYLSQIQPMVDEGRAVPLFAVGVLEDGEVVRDPNVPDVPTFTELYSQLSGRDLTSIEYEAYRAFVVPGFFFQKGLWSNEGTDQSVLDRYHQMTEELNADPQFREETEAALGGYDLASGEATRAAFREAVAIDPEVMAFAKDFLVNEHGAALD